jgi:antitoxin component YwqK of YwqJK toxin-antitoxin module
MKEIKYFILSINILFFVVQGISQTSKSDTVFNYTDINGNKQGYWIKKFKNGNYAYKAYFVNNIPVGPYYRYYENGNLLAKIDYAKDKSGKGKAVLYWDDGKKMAEGNYVDIKIKDSIWNMYATDGSLIVKIQYNKGFKNGKEIKYFRSKYPSEEITWKNGIKDGVWRWYYDGGQIRMETKYVNGEREGPFRVYYKSGNPYIIGHYKNSLREGKWTFYLYDGTVDKVVNYKNGVADNEVEMELELTKKIEEWDKNKGKIPEPTIENLMNSNQRR